jgi:hypothetical protein
MVEARHRYVGFSNSPTSVLTSDTSRDLSRYDWARPADLGHARAPVLTSGN